MVVSNVAPNKPKCHPEPCLLGRGTSAPVLREAAQGAAGTTWRARASLPTCNEMGPSPRPTASGLRMTVLSVGAVNAASCSTHGKRLFAGNCEATADVQNRSALLAWGCKLKGHAPGPFRAGAKPVRHPFVPCRPGIRIESSPRPNHLRGDAVCGQSGQRDRTRWDDSTLGDQAGVINDGVDQLPSDGRSRS